MELAVMLDRSAGPKSISGKAFHDARLLPPRRMVIMFHEKELSVVLSEFARTLVTDFPIQGILNHLVERIVEVLPITAAGVTLISEGMAPRYVAASDESAMRFERLQTEIGQGPCLLAYESGEAVAIPDLHTGNHFPLFAPAAVVAGIAAVFTFPLRHGDTQLGALGLYRDTPGELAPHVMAAAQTLADVASAYLLNAEARDEARATSDRFHYTSMHDPLTGLANRLLLQQRLEHAAARAERSPSNVAILFADLDRFKQVNDTFGHGVGDELLLAVAQRLAGLVRPGDTLARVSGDEFVFLCEDLSSPDDVEILAQRLDEAFGMPFVLAGGTELTVTASVGMAFAGPGDDISDQLVVDADMAMYQAKRKGGAGHQVIDRREALQTSDHHRLQRDLREAFARDELDVAYQPIVRSSDGLFTGVEALVRWTHPKLGPVSPISLVAAAEQSGLITELGAWVLERSCRARVRWLTCHPDVPLDLAVNVSCRQLMSLNFCSTVASMLVRTGMDPASLILEITENIFIEDGERATTVMADLRDLGIRLALDDFGTGYSSLSYLRQLPLDILKIDRSFIAGIGHASTGAAIVAAVTNLAHVLGLTVTAEGVESQCQRDQVSAIGCESAQGYFFAPPMSAFAISAHLGALPGPLYLPASPAGMSVCRAGQTCCSS
jgi:diguanylate cyclase (GGDEF)-like protein